MAYSMDLRERVVDALHNGESVAAVARRFAISRPAVDAWRKRSERDALAPDKTGPKSPTKITPQDDQLMLDEIVKNPGITANALRERISVEVAECTVCRRLKKLGLTLKKSR